MWGGACVVFMVCAQLQRSRLVAGVKSCMLLVVGAAWYAAYGKHHYNPQSV
jgi:hypothetical protein